MNDVFRIFCRVRDVRPLPVLIVLTVLAGLILAARPAAEQADQTLWTFAATHAQALESPDAAGVTPLESYAKATHRTVEIARVEPRPMALRLHSLLAGDDPGSLPDVVQLEMGTAVSLLDRPADEIGLLPLDDLLERDGLRDQFLPQRLAAWQRDGTTYGLPMDVHPVALAYRVDLWQAAGLDPTAAATWQEFALLAERYTAHWSAAGHPERTAIEFARTTSEHLTLLLQQQGIDFGVELDDERVTATVRFAAERLADGTARPTSAGHARWARDFAAGDVGVLWMPDWRVAYLELAAPELAGKAALMPLPRFSIDDAPTASWGGTMLSIPAGVDDAEAAWKLAKFVAIDPASLAGRRRVTAILPALPSAWGEAVTPSNFWAEPPVETYAQLAPLLPETRPSTRDRTAAGLLSLILSQSVDDLDAGLDLTTFDQRLRERLSDAQREVDRRSAFREHQLQ